jgi:hypothetical protein
VTRDAQPSQPTTPPPAGSYSGTYTVAGTVGALSFYVAPGRTAIQDVSANVTMTCSPGNGSSGGRMFVIDSVPLPANGTFSTTVTRTGNVFGNVAHETYNLVGHVHGLAPSGVPRIAGSLTETLTYTASSVTYTCTSEKLAWYTTRDAQPSPQPTTPPPAGSYSGHYFVPGAQGVLSFSVASGSAAIQNVSANISVRCSPNGPSIAIPFVINAVALPTNGTFGTTSMSSSQYQGHPLAITVGFHGHVHGRDKNNLPRLAGSVTVTATYAANGTTYTCTSETLPWYAIKS